MAAPRRLAHVVHLSDQPSSVLGRPPPSHHSSISGVSSSPEDDPHLRRRLPAPAYLLTPRALATPSAGVAALEARLSSCDREIESLLLDNQRLAATHVSLSQELIAANHELQVCSVRAARSRAEAEAEVGRLIERSMQAEAEARVVGQIKSDLDVVVADVAKLVKARDELAEKMRAGREELDKVAGAARRSAALKAEIEAMRNEIRKGRAAIEFEKKVYADNIHQSQQMEASMATMAHDIEKLRTELINAEKRVAAATAAANPGYVAAYGTSELTYGGGSCADPYGLNQAQAQAQAQTQQTQAQRSATDSSHYGSHSAAYAQAAQQTNTQR